MSTYSAAFFIIALLLFTSLGQARHEPADRPNRSTTHPLDQGSEMAEGSSETAEEACGGVAEEECLMRRTLVAHTDYIYTQGKGKKH